MYVTGVNMATSEELHKQEVSSKNEIMYPGEDVKNVYKHEHILNSKVESLERRIDALITTWGELGSLHKCPSKENLKSLTEFLKSHTLNIVLSANWLKYKEKNYVRLVNAIIKCSNTFGTYKGFKQLCQKLSAIAKSPWQNATIIRMLNCSEPTTCIQDYNFFVHEESGYFISMRLKKLCEDRCEDMALNLTRAYIKCCEWAEFQNKSMFISDDQKKFVFDVYLALLFKHNNTVEMSVLLKKVTLGEGVDMVRRFVSKVVSASKIWLHSVRIAQLSATIFLTRGVMQPYEVTSAFLKELLEIWLPTYKSDKNGDELQGCLRRIMKNAISSPHMYLVSNQLHSKFGVTMRSYNVEVYIQALNTDLNLLEKLRNENEHDKADEISTRVSEGYLKLASLLDENLNVSRECVLSAFSLKPTESCFHQIEDLARASGYEVLDTGQWKCAFHPPPKSDDEILILCDKCEEFMAQLQINPALRMPNTALTEALNTNNMGLNGQLCDDLVVILFCARYQMLSWLQNWSDLQRLCVMYLDNPIRTKNVITELKYLEIDYTPFLLKRELEPEPEIEPNFDDQYEYDYEEDIIEEYEIKTKRKRRRILSSSSDDDYVEEEEEEDEEELEFHHQPHSLEQDPIAIPRSNPEVLKTLRNFRRELKTPQAIPPPPTEPSWYDMYNQPVANELSQSSSCNSRSPVLFTTPSNVSQTLPVIKIRKDIYKQEEQLNTFFNNNMNIPYEFDIIVKDNIFSENFSKQPVIQENLIETDTAIKQEQDYDTQTTEMEHQVPDVSLNNGADINTENIEDDLLNDASDDADSFKGEDLEIFEKDVFSDENDIFCKILQEKRTCNVDNNNARGTKTEPTAESSKGGVEIACVECNSDCDDDCCISRAKRLKVDVTNLESINLISRQIIGCDFGVVKGEKVEKSDVVKKEMNFVSPKRSTHCTDIEEFKSYSSDNIINIIPKSKVVLEINSEIEEKIRQEVEKRAKLNAEQIDEESNSSVSDVECKESVVHNLNRNNDETIIIRSDSDSNVDSNNESKSSQKFEVSCKALYQLKECRVVLTRLRINKSVKKQSSPFKRQVLRPLTTRGSLRKAKDKCSALENKVQSGKDENYNLHFNVPIHKSPRNVLSTNNSDGSLEALKKKLLFSPDKMNPRVVLQRLEESCMKSLLAQVPGVSDTNLFRPDNTDRIVNVVQIAGGRATSTVPAPNTQTSTQVSPHIQRIGQPRNEKSDTSNNPETSSPANQKSSTNTYTISKPVVTQSPTLINILSQQIIRPSPSNNTRQQRTGPLINILSQQTIKTATNATTIAKTTTTTVTSDAQGNNTTRIIATNSEPQQIINQIVNPGRTTGPIKTVVGTSNSEQGRIVQFICKSTDGKLIPVTSFPSNRLVKVATTQAVTTSSDSASAEESFTKMVPCKKIDTNEISETLPKFQQAFGKSVYQNNVDSTNSTNITNNATADVEKCKTQLKTSTVNVQPIQGGVIYTRQMPVGQTINLIPQTRGQVFRIATTNADQISLVKDTVIHSKMSALLAAALQGKPKNAESVNDSDGNNEGVAATSTTTRVHLTRPTLVQSARIVKPVIQIPTNVIRNTPQTNLSSTTLEQLREFDMVYKQVKERSSTSTPAETSATPESSESSPPRISVTYLNQGQKLNCAPVVVVSSYSNLQPAASPALSVASQGSSSPCVTPAPTPTPVLPKVAAKSSKGKSVKNTPMHASKTSPIPKPQQKPQEDEHTTQRIFDILAEYAEQLRNSPDLNNKPAPRRRSNPPTNPSQNSKRKKSSSSKKTGQCSSLSNEADIDDPRTVGSEDSSCGVVQLSMQDEEQTPTTVHATESNDSTTTTTRQQLILTDSSQQTRNLIIADSSVGEALKMPNTAVLVPGNYIMPVSMVKGGQQIAVVSGGSKILATVPARSGPNMLLFQSFLNQNRKANVPTVKYSTIQPISGISSQTLTGVSAQPPVILPPPAHGISTVTLGQPIAIKKLDDSDRVNTELLLTISQSRENNCSTTEDTPQPDSSTNLVKIEKADLDENTATSDNNSTEKTFSFQQKPLIGTPIATPVIAQTIKEEVGNQSQTAGSQTIMTLNINQIENKGETKVEERVQSVLVTAGSSNGPMLAHSPPQYKQSDCTATNEQTKDEFLRNGGKRNEKVQQSTVFTLQGKAKKAATGGGGGGSVGGRLDREVQQICMQRRQAAIERELRLQKSLSEECEDLGVDEPSTSDLFPEALLFDANNSPSFDQTSQRSIQQHEKEESKLTLFSDDDFMFEPGQYQTGDDDNQLCYEEVVDARILTNGQGNSESPCEDNTLLQTCTSMSDVTLSSPISPDTYHTNTPPPLNKYMHKYTNKKRNEKVKQVDNWPTEVSSSEDTTGSNELGKCSSSPDICLNKRSDEELSEGSFKVVRLSISKAECSEIHCHTDDNDSLSGRGARKSVKKQCSCCNGSDDNNSALLSRKRPSSQQHTTNPHKKAFPNKKR